MKLKNITKIYFLLLFVHITNIVIAQVKPPVIRISFSEVKVSLINGVAKYKYNKWKSERLNNKFLDGEYAVFLERLSNSDIYFRSYINSVIEKGSFNKGYKNGLWKTLYKNKLVKTINYRNGLVIGRYRVYNTKGTILYKTTFGAKGNGKFEDYYYKTGVLKQEGNYKNGKKEGEWCDYNELGETTKITVYNKGMPQE